jgi:hypothetical protein
LYSAIYPVIESSTGRIAFMTKSGESNNFALNIYHSWVTIWNINTLPSEKLVVDGTGLFSGIDATNGKFTNWHFGNNLQLSSSSLYWKITFTWNLNFRSWTKSVMSINNSWNVKIGDDNEPAKAKLDIDWGLMLWGDTCDNNDDVWKLSLIHYHWNFHKMLVICWYSWDNQNNRERIPIIFISWSGGWVFPTDPAFPEIISGVYQEQFNPNP